MLTVNMFFNTKNLKKNYFHSKNIFNENSPNLKNENCNFVKNKTKIY